MSHQLIFSCKISVWSFLILTRYVCIVAHGGCRCCCYYLAPQTMHSVNGFLPARRFSLQCHTIRALFFSSSQIRLLCPHLKSASKSIFASSKVTRMFFPCSLNQSLSQLSTRPGPRFTRCISVSNCDHYLSKGLDGPLHQVTLTHACVLLCVIRVCLWHVCYSACVEVKGQLARIGPLFHLLGAGDWTQIVPLGGKCLCPLRHLRVLTARVHW